MSDIKSGALTVAQLTTDALAGNLGPPPNELVATSVFWVHHGTRLSGDTTYRNQYILVRVGGSFGACAFEPGELETEVSAETSGRTLHTLLEDPRSPVRIAALDAYLAELQPHRDMPGAEQVILPAGPPETRAQARDDAIAGLMDVPSGSTVALIGVVNPLVAAIRERGAHCLPCDMTLRETQWGDPVTSSMMEAIEHADAVIATGMTLSNGSFDDLVRHCRERSAPLIVYAQTGSAIARAFLGNGVTALSAEPFPFSQFSAGPTTLYRYQEVTVSP